MPKLSVALLQVSMSQSAIDPEKGIIIGAKVMELGKLATFKGQDGKPKSVRITSKHIDALLGLAGNRALPFHLTHDWFESDGQQNGDTVEMQARVGAMKSFRKDSEGNLIGDILLKDGPDKSDILFGAEHNPEDNMLSAVYGYDAQDPDFLPKYFRAVDLVPKGAATTALFSESNPNENKTMPITIDDLKTILADPQAKAMIQGCLDGHTDAEEAAEMEAADTAEMEAGVTPDDKKPEDDKKPAILRSTLRINRATVRLCKASAPDKTALLAELKTQAEATVVAKLGQHKFIENTGSKAAEDGEAYIAAQMDAGCKTRAHAIARMGKDKPELYATFRS